MAKPYLAVILIFADLVGMVIRPINELPEQLAEALQVSPGVISKWELGPRPIYEKQTEKRQNSAFLFAFHMLILAPISLDAPKRLF